MVSVQRVQEYDLAQMRSAVKEHFRLLGVYEDLHPGMKVLLKPNLLMKRRPEEVTTTHPILVEAVALELQEMGIADITLIDSPGGPYTPALLQGIYGASGMADVAARTGIALNSDYTYVRRVFLQGESCKEFNLLTPLTQADYIINLCKLKTHGMTTLSGAVKNLFGSVPGLQKPELHFRFPDNRDFSNMLIDLSLLVAPNLTLVDAVVAMEGDGPSGGTPKQVGLTLGSKNLYRLDRILCEVAGLDPTEVATMAHAMRRGLCPEEFGEITLVGHPLGTTAPFVLPKSKSVDFVAHAPRLLRPFLGWVRDTFLTPRPVVNRNGCIGCGKCAESCPPKTIEIVKHKAVIDHSRCIRCYCCHEMCPPKAIEIRRFSLFNW